MSVIITPTLSTQKHYLSLARPIFCIDLLVTVFASLTLFFAIVNATQLADKYRDARDPVDDVEAYSLESDVQANTTRLMIYALSPGVIGLIAMTNLYCWTFRTLLPVVSLAVDVTLFPCFLVVLLAQIVRGNSKVGVFIQ